jgi:mRNA interferase YafQ
VRTPSYSGQFRRDVKRAEKRGKDLSKLRLVIHLLIDESPLPVRLRDHPLKGEWKLHHDLHIEPDWILIYRIDGNSVYFERTGTHADLFEN